MIDDSVPFIVRRARLLLGMSRDQFAMLYGVDETAASQWERGLAHPGPATWARLRSLTLRAGSLLDEDMVRVSPLCKVIVGMEDLTRPVVRSRGIIEALKEVGVSEGEDQRFDFAEFARKSPLYEVSGTRALEIIRADPRWLRGDIVYAEIHCLSPALGDIWLDAMVAPLPERIAAIIEFARSRRGPEGGFKVHLVGLEDMPFNEPQ
jgi:transcriptional regulator with XRE-family HTH domain